MKTLDIVIPTKLSQCKFYDLADSIFECSDSDLLGRISIYVLYTGDEDAEAQHIDDKLKGIRHKVIRMPYNFAKCSNAGADAGNGDVLLFLNDDVKFTSDAISHCLEIFEKDQSESVGTVGIKLLFEDGKIQHCGQMAYHNKGRFIGITHCNLNKESDAESRDFVSVGNTGAFMMIRRKDFIAAGKFDESFQHCFEDCVLNWKMLIAGKLNVTCASVSAIHSESATRKQQMSRDDVLKMKSFFNENFQKISQKGNVLARTLVDISQR